jgi:site-specific recombinase XerD
MHPSERLVNRDNFLITQAYLDHLLQVKNQNQNSVERYRFWLRWSLLWAMEQPFEKADGIQPAFSQYVSGLELASESKKKIVETVRAFFRWAKLYHGRRFSRLPAYWIEDLVPTKVSRGESVDYMALDDVLKMVRLKIAPDNLALRRDQAMTAMLFLSGARAGAATSLPIQAVHLEAHYPYIEQKPSLGVQTKNGRSATTFLHNIPELLETVRAWDVFVRANCHDASPWYAPIHQRWGEQRFMDLAPGRHRGTALNRRLHILEQAACLPHRSPHKYRHGYAIYGLQHCQTMAQYHALSRNLMHANIAITDECYVHLEEMERGRLLDQVSSNPTQKPDDELQSLLVKLDRENLHRAITLAADLLVRQ